jgi:hypothetical protein
MDGALAFLPLGFAILVGIAAQRFGRNGWKWGVLAFFAVVCLISLPFLSTPTLLRATFLLPIFVGIGASRSRKNGWVWGLGAFGASILVRVALHIAGIARPPSDPVAFASDTAAAVVIGSLLVTIRLCWNLRREKLARQKDDEIARLFSTK